MRRLLLALTSFALVAAAPVPAGGPVDVAPYVAAQKRIEVAPKRALNLVCMGEGDRTVLFEAGGSDWSVTWALVQPAVARHARACAYDRAGLGHSDPATDPRTPIAIVEDLHALIEAAGLHRPLVLVGHSLGGFDAKLYAALYPEDVAGLVLIDPADERPWDRTRQGLSKRFGTTLTAKAELLDRSFLAFLHERYGACSAAVANGPLDPASLTYRRCSDPPRAQLGPAIAAERQRIQVTPAYQKAQASEIINSVYADAGSEAAYEALFRPGAFGDKPLVVLTHGRFDREDPLDVLAQEQGLALHRETARLSRAGVQRTVPGAGHNIPAEAPAAVIEAVMEVLGRAGRR